MTGFTLPDENIHAPNENIDEEMVEKRYCIFAKNVSLNKLQ